MHIKPGLSQVLWMAAGAAGLLVVMLVTWRLRPTEESTARLASKSRRVELVDELRTSLASASEAEKSAVLAIADADARAFADQARAVAGEAGQRREELAALLEKDASAKEKSLLADFSASFDRFQALDRELLDLAVRHTNLRATAMSFGPATEAIDEMSAALARVTEKSARSADADRVKVLALGARAATLHLQTLLAPHIAEASDEKMDTFEAAMSEDDREVRRDLSELAAIAGLAGDADVQAAVASYGRFSDLRREILTLSRENSNVRSLSLSLDDGRKVMFLCLHSLELLRKAILEESAPGMDTVAPSNPRRLAGS
jgi:hypothetical protein